MSLFHPAPTLIRFGRRAALILPVLAAASFATDVRAQSADVYFQRKPLSIAPDTLAAPGLPSPVENYAVETPSWVSGISPKFNFNVTPWKEYPLSQDSKNNSEDSFGRIPLNGGSFGLEAEQKFDLKKIAPNEFVDSNTEKNAKKPFVGFSIIAPYNSE